MKIERKKGPETKASGVRLEIKALSEDGTFEGYASVWGTEDDYGDVVAVGAFTKSLAEHKANGGLPAMLAYHDDDCPIGVWIEMLEDARGLRCVGKLAMDTPKGAEIYALLKMGALTGLSIGFIAREWVYDAQTDIRTLTEIDLWEVSVVVFPANRSARVTDVKSAGVDQVETPKEFERLLREAAGFTKTEATAFVSRLMRLGAERRDAAEATARLHRAAQKLLNTIS